MASRFCSKVQKLPSLPPSLHQLKWVDDCERLKSLPELPSLCLSFCLQVAARHWRTFQTGGLHYYTIWADIIEDMRNTHNTMIADRAVIQILARIKFGTVNPYHSFCYPGDEIPVWFNHQTCGSSINNIMLPPYWNNDDFLALAFCIVFHWNKIENNTMFNTSCKLNFKTIDDGSLYEYHNYTWSYKYNKFSSDHVFIWYVERRSLESSEEMDGLDWPSTCSTEASFHIYPIYPSLDNVNNNESEYGEIKKFGVRFVNKQDMERCDAETERKNKRSFNECCESSESETVGFLEEEDEDESQSKKLKLM
nr:disease resistance-like protein DSC1 [Ziziphus jujuba var. spinosa]